MLLLCFPRYTAHILMSHCEYFPLKKSSAKFVDSLLGTKEWTHDIWSVGTRTTTTEAAVKLQCADLEGAAGTGGVVSNQHHFTTKDSKGGELKVSFKSKHKTKNVAGTKWKHPTHCSDGYIR